MITCLNKRMCKLNAFEFCNDSKASKVKDVEQLAKKK